MKRPFALVVLFVTSAALAQTLTTKGSVKANGTIKISSQSSQYVKVYALFPPEAGTDQSSHFGPYVMSQAAIDGITDRAIWSSVEKVAPSATPCSGPPGTDVCQLDAFGWYHVYDWGDVDSTLAYWFGFGSKAVNAIGFSQTQPPTNLATPYYVTGSSWIAHTGGVQDVVNKPQNGCTSWTGPSVQSISYAGGIATVQMGAGQVTDANGYPSSPTADDIVWISGAGSLNTPTSGATILSVDHLIRSSPTRSVAVLAAVRVLVRRLRKSSHGLCHMRPL